MKTLDIHRSGISIQPNGGMPVIFYFFWPDVTKLFRLRRGVPWCREFGVDFDILTRFSFLYEEANKKKDSVKNYPTLVLSFLILGLGFCIYYRGKTVMK